MGPWSGGGKRTEVPNAALQLLSPFPKLPKIAARAPHTGTNPPPPLMQCLPCGPSTNAPAAHAAARSVSRRRVVVEGVASATHDTDDTEEAPPRSDSLFPPTRMFFFGRHDFDRRNQAVLGCYIRCSCLYLVFAFQLLILILFVRLRVKCAVGCATWDILVPYLSLASDKWLWLLQDKSVFMFCYII